MPEAPKPGYNKEGKKIVGEKAIAPAAEGPHAGLLPSVSIYHHHLWY